MKSRELANLGIPHGKALKAAKTAAAQAARSGVGKKALREKMRAVTADPEAFTQDRLLGPLALALLQSGRARAEFIPRDQAAPYRRWGEDLDADAVRQMENACRLPVAVAGALLPDAHVGYGLPIGGVLAARGAIIPYAVGMDIACRMKMTVLDIPPVHLEKKRAKFIKALETETRFGVGASFRDRRRHPVMDEDWGVTRLTADLKDKAWSQLGTSGSGNHFVEFGLLELDRDELGLKAGTWLALLSHSGSRGAGGRVAQFYSKLAMDLHPELPRELIHLAWLDLDREEGREYWLAMQLMGRYAAANHELIHRHIAGNLGAGVLLDIENHHNFAWQETLHGREVIVHRKGATPAGQGQIGVIPGSMASPAYVVRGLGGALSLNSASHGAGRRMSRKAAKAKFTWRDIKRVLDQKNVELLTAGLDEAPMAYKDINQVMAAQSDLVEILARFQPRLVKMSPEGERPED